MEDNQFEITPDELNAWLGDEDLHLIDVREHFEYVEESIPKAKLLSLSSFDPNDVPSDTHKKIVFYCRSGKRSLHALKLWLLLEKNVSAYNLAGGIEAWKKCNLPIVDSKPVDLKL